MQELKTRDELHAAEVAAKRAFASIGRKATEPFAAELPERTLIYPIDYTMLGRPEFDALAEAAAAEGDETAYVVPYGTLEADWAGTYDHGLITLDFADYNPGDRLILEHLIYSPDGKWAAVTFHGDFAVAGGSRSFIERLRARLSDNEKSMTTAFLRDWEDVGRAGANIDWLHPLLVHLFGESKFGELRDQTSGPGSAS
jgi:hypothetical protein